MMTTHSGQRRKLQAKRNTGTARVDAAPFVWVSDRSTQRGQDDDGISAPRSKGLPAREGVLGQQNAAGSTGAADSTDATVQRLPQFVWISEYLQDAVKDASNENEPCAKKLGDSEVQRQGLQGHISQRTKPEQPGKQPSQLTWAYSWLRNRRQAGNLQQQPAAGIQLERATPQQTKPPAAQCEHQKPKHPSAPAQAARMTAGGAAAVFSAAAAAAAKVTAGWVFSTASPMVAQQLRLQPDNAAAEPAVPLQQQPPQQPGGHAAAVGGGGLLAMFHETSESAAAVYTETLKPTGELLWQLALGLSGLLAAVVVYVLLPLLRGCGRASRYLLLQLNKLLMPCRQRLHQLWNRRVDAAAAERAPARSNATAAGEHAMPGAAEPVPAVPQALSPAAAPPAAANPPLQQAFSNQQQQELLQYAQQQLVKSCGQQQGCILDLQQLSSSSSSLSSSSSQHAADSTQLSWLRTADRVSADAGYGSCAYRASLAGVPVAVQLYSIATPRDAELFAKSVRTLWGLRDTSLLRCLGAAIALLPADSCPAENVAVSPSSAQLTAGRVLPQQQPQEPLAVLGCVVVQPMQQPTSLLASLRKATLPDRQHQQHSDMSAAADASVAAGGRGPSGTAGSARLRCWSDRLQLAPQLAAAVQRLQTASTAAGTSTWLDKVTADQLAAAFVVDLAAHPPQAKLNTAVLRLGALQQSRAHDNGHNHTASYVGLLPALGDVLLQLAAAEPHSVESSSNASSSRSHPTSLEHVQCLVCGRLSAEGVAPDDELACAAIGQLAELVVTLWKHGVASQQQQEQQHPQVVPTKQQQQLEHMAKQQPTYSVAAAEGLSEQRSWFGSVLGRLSSHTPGVDHPGSSSYHDRVARNARLETSATEQAAPLQTGEVAPAAGASVINSASSGHGNSTERALDFDWTPVQQVAEKAAAWQAQQLERQQALAAAAAAAAAAEAAARRSRASEPPAWFICPITSSVMVDPVVAADGHTYERAAISHWLKVAWVPRSPMTNQVMQPVLVPNHVIRSAIMDWKQQQQQQQQLV